MVAQPEPMVTGDAVVLDVQIAQLPVRALSALIDLTVVFVAYVIGLLLWAATLTDLDSALSGAVLIIFTVLALVGYPIIFETTTRGRSLGKMALGLRVVSDDGGPERFRQALFRALAGFVEIWMFAGGPAVICSLVSPRGKRIGDVFAGTMVISERAPRLEPAAGDAAVDGVVGAVAAAVRAVGAVGRPRSSVPLPRTAVGPGCARSDGLPDLRRGGRADLPSAAAGRSSAVGVGRRARRAAPPGADPVEQVRAPGSAAMDDAAGRTARTMATRLRSARPAVVRIAPGGAAATTRDTLADADAGSPARPVRRIHPTGLMGHRCPILVVVCYIRGHVGIAVE